jgi:hypothetical protein
MVVPRIGESTTGGRSQLRTRIARMIMMRKGIACLGIAFSALIIIRIILPVFFDFTWKVSDFEVP